ncbi:hypothetical protein D9M69_598300 [compost metagenome]
MMSPPMDISLSCSSPSWLISVTDSSEGSTLFHAETHWGNWSKGVPMSTWNTSNFTSTASAGAVKYSRKMKNSDQVTDCRASFTLGTV